MLRRHELGALILRLVLGFTFFLHGLDKFTGGIDQTVAHFDSLGIPGFLGYVVALIELIGGIAMIAGIGTRAVAVLFAFIMVGAILIAKLPEGFLGGYELDVVLLAMSVYFIIANRSILAIDNIFFDK
ncbi:DoxX family protein [Salsuginibacillus kocurii]|uniref:DoxX family protein n=1 Tax=Salsuginibacillus kocurii TaxID=427078 RepID=UPI00035DA087|nr:DoxX family protein [Salsuginibacillus kocurii]